MKQLLNSMYDIDSIFKRILTSERSDWKFVGHTLGYREEYHYIGNEDTERCYYGLVFKPDIRLQLGIIGTPSYYDSAKKLKRSHNITVDSSELPADRETLYIYYDRNFVTLKNITTLDNGIVFQGTNSIEPSMTEESFEWSQALTRIRYPNVDIDLTQERLEKYGVQIKED